MCILPFWGRREANHQYGWVGPFKTSFVLAYTIMNKTKVNKSRMRLKIIAQLCIDIITIGEGEFFVTSLLFLSEISLLIFSGVLDTHLRLLPSYPVRPLLDT